MPPQYTSELRNGCIQAMPPATGWHGTWRLPLYVVRHLIVFDVDETENAINGGEAVFWPAATPFEPLAPIAVAAGTAARLRTALQLAPPSRESAKQSWLAWLRGRKFARNELRKTLGTITAEEQRWLDSARKGAQRGGASRPPRLAPTAQRPLALHRGRGGP